MSMKFSVAYDILADQLTKLSLRRYLMSYNRFTHISTATQ